MTAVDRAPRRSTTLCLMASSVPSIWHSKSPAPCRPSRCLRRRNAIREARLWTLETNEGHRSPDLIRQRLHGTVFSG
eukprot:scaffold14625_cov125-Isochrysis_galbana.AAC.7